MGEQVLTRKNYLVLLLILIFLASNVHAKRLNELFYKTRLEWEPSFRVETLSLDKNGNSDKMANFGDFNLKTVLKAYSTEKTLIQLTNDLNVLAMGITDYGFSDYDFQMLLDNLNISIGYDFNRTLAMTLNFGFEYLEDQVTPFDDNFPVISSFILGESFFHRLNDYELYYKMGYNLQIPLKYTLELSDFLYEYKKNSVSVEFTKALGRYTYLTTKGYYFSKDYPLNPELDYNEGNASFSLYKYFPKTYEDTKEYPHERKEREAYEKAGKLLKNDGFLWVMKSFEPQKIPSKFEKTRDMVIEGGGEYEHGNLKNVKYGDYDEVSGRVKISQNLTDNMKIEISDNFIVNEYLPEGRYYQDYRYNQLKMTMKHYLDDTTSMSYLLESTFQDYDTFTDESYSSNKFSLGMQKYITDKITFFMDGYVKEYKFDQETTSYVDYNEVLVTAQTLYSITSSLSLELGGEFQYYKYNHEETNTLYQNYSVQTFFLAALYRVNKSLSVDLGIKDEKFEYKDPAKGTNRYTTLTFISLNGKF